MIKYDQSSTSDSAIVGRLQRRMVILTGMSGAGISTALKVFEDLGYEAVDNLRLELIKDLLAAVERDSETHNEPPALAIAVDARSHHFSVDKLLHLIKEVDGASLLFLDCSDEILQRRFTETRRRHPLASDRPVTDGIRRERTLVTQLSREAERVIDTSLLSGHELRRIIAGHYHLETATGLTVFVMSFAYRRGIPREADIVMDVRFFNNPHWDTTLRPLNGQDEAVAAYIRRDPEYAAFIESWERLLKITVPRYANEGKSYLTIAIGCSGGRHRSVMVAEETANFLSRQGYIVGIGHRDL